MNGIIKQPKMMEQVSSEDTNGDSTFEFVGDPATVNTNIPNMALLSEGILSPVEMEHSTNQEQTLLSSFIPQTPPPPPPPVPLPILSTTQTIASSAGNPICYAPRPTYDSLSASSVPSSTIDLSSVQDTSGIVAMSISPEASPGVWGWIKQSEILNKFAEKAKNSVDTMITTLDPGMKDYIYSGGDVDLLVLTESEWVLSAIREAFQKVFGRATVDSCPSPASTGAPQPVGFSAGVRAAEERCQLMRTQGNITEDQAILTIQNILVEITPERWFDITCLVLQDPRRQSFLQSFTQPTAVPYEYVIRAQDATPADYPFRWSGLAVTMDQTAQSDQWRETLTGITQREMILLAARALAGVYKGNQ